MGTYIGQDNGRGQMGLWYQLDNGALQEVPHVVKHSPGGLAWGYEGNGPSDTALSILAHITEDRTVAEAWYQDFKREVVAGLTLDHPFELERADVEQWLARRGVGVAPEWEISHEPAVGRGQGPPSVTDVRDRALAREHLQRAAEQLAQRSAALDAREAALDRREAQLRQRERRLDAQASSQERQLNRWESGIEAQVRNTQLEGDVRWTLSAAPVKEQLRTLQRETADDLATVARGINVEPEWAAGVLDGSITEVDLPHVQQICEGLHCTPYDFWGADEGRTIMHAYGPELWPRYIEPLSPPPPDLGPELGL
ncbi:MAG TPA: DUF6166 domain-containing protein [Acidimicrobiales bacterium]|nr:DUF6166 domain-containing protein [Acidimicrobiales bacterium]